jgi:hypothetical protein
MAKKKKNNKPRQPQPKKDKALQAMYDQIRRELTAEDLQAFTETDKGIPADEVLDEMERIHRRLMKKRA